MEENNNENIQKTEPRKKSWLFLVISIIIGLLIAGGLYFAYFNRKEPVIVPVQEEPNKETPVAQSESVPVAPSMPESFKLLTPIAGETVCMNTNATYKISWEVPSDLQLLKLHVISPGIDSPLGQFPAVKEMRNGVGYGELVWNFKSAGNFPTTEKDIYRIQIGGEYQGKEFSKTIDEVFSIKTCP